MSVRRAQQEITAREFAEWLAFAVIDGWGQGEQRADMRAGVIAATVANVHRSRESRTWEAADFFPHLRCPGSDEAAPMQIAAQLTTWARGYQAAHERRQRRRAP